MDERPVDEQVRAALAVLDGALASARIVGVYLFGSAVEDGLRPDSDIDLFVVTDRRLGTSEKARLVGGLLPISGRATRPSEWRPLEVTAVAEPEVRPWRYPARIELQYGEWLRTAFLAGDVEPDPAANPDLAVLITTVRDRGRPLVGPPAREVLDAVPSDDLARAMVDSVPSLLDDLEGDTRNVLLTLARIWATVSTGEIRSKDSAADWALERLRPEDRPMLAHARDLYRGGGYGEWPSRRAVRALADRLVREITATARSG